MHYEELKLRIKTHTKCKHLWKHLLNAIFGVAGESTGSNGESNGDSKGNFLIALAGREECTLVGRTGSACSIGLLNDVCELCQSVSRVGANCGTKTGDHWISSQR